MLVASDLPQFLWEHAVIHAAYLRERAPTKALQKQTPYEAWYHKKPNVSHLREFGSPVFILLQGQHQPLKLQPCSKRHVFIDFEDESHSVKYYSAETRKVLTSRNFRFLDNLPPTPSQPEAILLDPAVPREGECARLDNSVSTQQPRSIPERSLPEAAQKRLREEPQELDDNQTRRKLRTLAPVNYRFLNDPFPDEEDEMYQSSEQIACQTYCDTPLGGEDPKTLQEAQASPEWLEWEKAIRVELEQLTHMGTWQLLDCPTDAIPLANKWVFVRKYNKMGELVKYKARLVVKGCAQ